MAIISKSPTLGKDMKPRSFTTNPSASAKMNTNVGSGARPTKSRVAIKTSAPMDVQGLSRRPSGALK